MTESLWQSARPGAFTRFFKLRELFWQFTWREVQGRYRGSYLGLFWALLTPFCMLAAYTFVFNVIFKARWAEDPRDNWLDFALRLFSGIIVFNVFAESVTAAPLLIVRNPNYVKKVVFPLEILPASTAGAAVIHSLVGWVIVLLGVFVTDHRLYWTSLYLPLLYVPLIALTLGVCWFVAALGVFLRDLPQVVTVLVQLLMFLSPVFYSMKSVPEHVRPAFEVNPLSVIIESFRRCVVLGRTPDWLGLGVVTAVSLVAMLAGYVWFMKLKWAFADVI